MLRSKKFANPFYGLLVVVGLAFCITAMTYGVMMVRETRAAGSSELVANHALMQLMNDHGNTILLIELALLAVCTFGAIGTDEFWQRRARERAKRLTISENQSRVL
jgi:hypothetical protein